MTIAIRVRLHNLLLETVLWGDTELMRGPRELWEEGFYDKPVALVESEL
jgi:hypothetical protein